MPFDPASFDDFVEVTLDAGDPVGQSYSVGVTLDTATLIAEGRLKSDGSDLVVAWDSTGSGVWIEIDAHLRPMTNGTLSTSTSTQLWFALNEPAGIGSYPYANRYRLYYGNAAADPADRQRDGMLVYRFFDDFVGTGYDATVWYVHPDYRPAVSVSNGVLEMDGALSPGSVWFNPSIRMVSQTDTSVPTFTVSYASPFAGESRFRSLVLTDDVRPVNYLMDLPVDQSTFGEYTTFVSVNGSNRVRLVRANPIPLVLVTDPTAIAADVWYDFKVTVELTDATPGSEVSLHSVYLDDVFLDDSSSTAQGGYLSSMTSGEVGITTDPGSKGEFDWFLMRDYTASEPSLSADPYVSLRAERQPGGTSLIWGHPGAAPSFDVIRGNIHDLAESPGIVDLGAVVCIEEESTDTSTDPGHLDPTVPSADQAFFYVLRANGAAWSSTYGHSTVGGERVPMAGDCFP